MDDQPDEIDKLLEQPIEIDCYMVSLTWWNQWRVYVKSKESNRVEPGIIYNIDLVYLLYERIVR